MRRAPRILTLCVWLALAPVALAKDKLVVMDLVPGAEVTAEIASGLTEAVAAAVARPGFYDVLSTSELHALIGVERQRQLLGCSEETGCMTEIGSALGARYLLTGSVGRLGASFQLALQLVDTQKGQVLNRSVRLAPTIDVLRARVPFAVAAATGLPAPKPPSAAPSLASLGGGAVLLLGGGIAGGLAVLEDGTLAREQERGVAGALATRATYDEAHQRLTIQKTGSLIAAGVGAGLLALGVVLYPEDVERGELVLSVGPASIGIAGVFP